METVAPEGGESGLGVFNAAGAAEIEPTTIRSAAAAASARQPRPYPLMERAGGEPRACASFFIPFARSTTSPSGGLTDRAGQLLIYGPAEPTAIGLGQVTLPAGDGRPACPSDS